MQTIYSFGTWVRKRRKALDLTQEDLATCVGCSLATIQKIEQETRRPSEQIALRLAGCLNLPAEQYSMMLKVARGKHTVDRLPLSHLHSELSSARQPEPIPNNLPAPLTPLVGRKQEIAALMRLLRRDGVRLVTMTGAGGTGKTRLALQVATDLLRDYADGVFFVGLASITDPELVIPTIASVLGLRSTSDQPIHEQLQGFLRDKHLLLLLDNLEHLLSATPDIARLMAAGAGINILTTSREILRLQGEYHFPVAPLKLPDLNHPQTYEVASQSEAVELFVQRAQAIRPDFELNDENSAAVAEICVRLDGLPLAIELAAARLLTLTPQQMLSTLSNRLRSLTLGARDLPARQQTFRATLEWSHNLLSEAEKTLFARLAVFNNGCTTQAVEEVCGPGLGLDTTDGLVMLLNKSLLGLVDDPFGEARFVMLETIHEYAWEQLWASGESEIIKRRYAEYFTCWAEEIEPELRGGPTQLERFKRIEADYGNLRAILEWAFSDGELEIGQRLTAAIWRFWYRRFNWHEWGRWVGLSFEYIAGSPLSMRAALLVSMGTLQYRRSGGQGDHLEDAARLIAEAASIYEKINDRYNLAWSLIAAATLSYSDPLQYDTTKDSLAQSIGLFRELDDKAGLGFALTIIGEIARLQGDHDAAQAAYEECLAICRDNGDKDREYTTLGNLAVLLAVRGNTERAVPLYKQALALSKEVASKTSQIFTMVGSATVYGLTGQSKRSTRLMGAYEAIALREGLTQESADQQSFEYAIKLNRENLGEEMFQFLIAEGRRMSLQEAIAYALADDEG